MISLGERLRHFIEQHGLSQMEMARRAGVSQAVISQLVTGRKVGVRRAIQDRIESALTQWDFLISCAQADAPWVRQWLVPRLQEADLRVCLDVDQLAPGDDLVARMDRAMGESGTVLVVLSPHYLASESCSRELGLAERSAARIVPIMAKECQPGPPLSTLQYSDFTREEHWDREVARLIATVGGRRAVPIVDATPKGESSPSVLPPVWNVPHLRNPNFTGREDLLLALRQALTSGRHAAVTQAIRGLGGVGKTQLAVEFCYRHAVEYEVVWWVRAEEPATLAADYAGLAAALNLPEQDEPEQGRVVEVVRRWFEHHGGWLLVLDNAAEPDAVRRYLPRSATGQVILTSRHATWTGTAAPLEVPIWPKGEATEFLTRRTGEDDPELAAELAQALGYLPLALEQAAAYIEEVGACSLATYLDLFRQQQELLARGHASTGYEGTVATTWEISFKRVAKESQAGAALLDLCAFLAPADIPLNVIADHAELLPHPLRRAASDRMALDEAVAVARRYSLVQATAETLSMHRLVQSVARERLTAEEQRRWGEAAVSVVAQAFPSEGDDVRTWRQCAELLPHALATAGHAEALGVGSRPAGTALYKAGVYFRGRAQFRDADSALRRALALRTAAYGADHPEVAAAENDLGRTLRDMGVLAGARESFERALRIDEATLGPDHPSVARDVNDLGSVLQGMGDLVGARECFERALRIDEATFGPDHPNVAIRVNNLGSVLRAMLDLKGARECVERALQIDEATFGPDHPNVATGVSNLGKVLHDVGDLKGARECYERALRIDEATLGPDHPEVATDVNNLGLLLQDMGDLTGARECFQRALQIGEATLGPDHPNVAISLNNLGSVLQAMGDLPGARECLERALAIFVRFLGEGHPHTRHVRGNLASLG